MAQPDAMGEGAPFRRDAGIVCATRREEQVAVTTHTLNESYYPADQSEPVLDTTVGGILRDAAQAAPDQPALIGGHPDPEQRRRWTYS